MSPLAAGAETVPEGSTSESESDSEGIANIVDSVLADLRPKIFEEISGAARWRQEEIAHFSEKARAR